LAAVGALLSIHTAGYWPFRQGFKLLIFEVFAFAEVVLQV
jgi:hypothetical protein